MTRSARSSSPAAGPRRVLDVLLATLDPGDEVVLTDPIYAGLVNRVRLAGGVPVFAPLQVVDGEWRLDRDALAAAVTERTVALLMMSPSMPTGCVLDAEDWAAVARAVRRATTCSCSTTPRWRRCCSTAARRSGRSTHAGMAERTVIAGSMSKAHRMIGWRVGWIAGPAVDRRPTRAGSTPTTRPARSRSPGARRRRCCAGRRSTWRAATAELERRRDAIFAALPGWPLVRPAGGWSLLLDVAALGSRPAAASAAMLAAGVAATRHGRAGARRWPRGYVRFVFSAEPVERLCDARRAPRPDRPRAVSEHRGGPPLDVL